MSGLTDVQKFLSTLSLRRATGGRNLNSLGIVISIHALLAESDRHCAVRAAAPADFYPRSPCGERRQQGLYRQLPQYFYPRSPCGERRRQIGSERGRGQISIHALLAESDQKSCGRRAQRWYFYPRSPCGERPNAKRGNQSEHCISIHALLAESDEPATTGNDKYNIFLSTLSLRRATW